MRGYSITQLQNTTRKYWEVIFWQESTDYDELLTVCELYTYYWVSPLHAPGNDCRKPHWHVIVGEDSPWCPYRKRSKYGAITMVKGATWSRGLDRGIAYPVDRLNRAIAYLVHLNNPEKQQFDQGLYAITTNSRDKLDGIVKDEPGFDCATWDDEHKPYSFMHSLGIISSEGFLTPSETVKLVSWYANHGEVFEGRTEDYSSLRTQKYPYFVEV